MRLRLARSSLPFARRLPGSHGDLGEIVTEWASCRGGAKCLARAGLRLFRSCSAGVRHRCVIACARRLARQDFGSRGRGSIHRVVGRRRRARHRLHRCRDEPEGIRILMFALPACAPSLHWSASLVCLPRQPPAPLVRSHTPQEVAKVAACSPQARQWQARCVSRSSLVAQGVPQSPNSAQQALQVVVGTRLGLHMRLPSSEAS